MKNALVFGASGFLGQKIAYALVEAGYSVSGTYCSHKPVQDQGSPAISLLPCNIGDPVAVNTVFKKIIEEKGTPDIVINAAGIAIQQSLLADISAEDILKVVHIDLTGALFISREAARAMHERHNGVIIHISSMWGRVGASCEVPYSAAKGGLNAMVKALAKELAPDGIRVNAVAPGLLISPMNAHLPTEALELFRSDTPLDCYITPDDVWSSVKYLIDSPHVTGQILAVDGGIVI